MKIAVYIVLSLFVWVGCESGEEPSAASGPPVYAAIRSVFHVEGSTPSGTRDSLVPPFPNPYNHQLGDTTITIKFLLADSADVKVIIQNPIGDSVAVFKDTRLAAGEYSGNWTPLNALGEPLRAGLYFVTLRVDPNKRNYIDSRLLYIQNND